MTHRTQYQARQQNDSDGASTGESAMREDTINTSDDMRPAGPVPVWGTPPAGQPTGGAAGTLATRDGTDGTDAASEGERHLHLVATDGPGGILDGEVIEAALPATRDGGPAGRAVGEIGDVLPSWAKSWEAFSGLVRERTTRAARVGAFHTLRLPLYWLRVSLRAPRTAGRMVRWVFDWSTDAKGRAVRNGLAYGPSMGGLEATSFHRVSEQHRESKRLRMSFTLTVLVLVGLVAFAGARHVPGSAWWAVLGVLAPVLGAFSRDPEAPIVTPIRYANLGAPPLDATLIATALDALGIAQLSRGLKAEGVKLAGPIHRDGPGWRADVDLPAGVPAGDVAERRDKLAAGLRRPLSCVWPETDPDAHEARLILWVGDRAMNRAKPRPWALAKTGRVDLFRPFPIGTDQRGKPVTLCLMFASMVIGAVPRMGKTFALRLILLAAALDALAELHVYDLKGGADLRGCGQVAHRFRIGDDEEDIAYLADDTATMRIEMARRYKVLRNLPESICPEGKVTPELAARKDLRLHPIVVGIDECQLAFEHPKYGAQIEADITDLVKRGPAVGIMVILATQRPDAKSIPAGISANAVLRFCLKVMGHQANDMVLGSGAYKAGIRATMFARSDKGTGYLVGEGDDPQITTIGYLDGPAAKVVAARARTARIKAGTLTGYAADLDATPDQDQAAPTLLDDLAHVMTTGEPRIWSEVLLERLTAHRPDTYGGWSVADLGNAAAAYGLSTVQIGKREGGKVVNRKGIDRANVITALTERDQRRGA